MKKHSPHFSLILSLVLVFPGFFFFLTPATHAECDIRPWADQYMDDLYAYSTFGLSKPNLVIETGKLAQMNQGEISQYGISKKSNKKYYIGAYTDGDTIGIYQKLFSSYKKCDKVAKSKLRAMIAHEYTHYIDGSSYGLSRLSGLIETANYEKTAIIGEHTLAKLVWNKSINPTRNLTSREKKTDAVTLRNYFRSRRGN